jgi:hypothetical protein
MLFLRRWGWNESFMNKKISIDKAIESDAKLIFECEEFITNNLVKMEMKIVSFSKIEADLYDEIEVPDDMDDGVLRIINLDVINLSKKPVNQFTVINNLILVDEDGYEYDCFYDSDLYFRSNFAINVNLPRFTGWSSIQPLRPKIKANGSILFLLPHGQNNFFLTVKEIG